MSGLTSRMISTRKEFPIRDIIEKSTNKIIECNQNKIIKMVHKMAVRFLERELEI